MENEDQTIVELDRTSLIELMVFLGWSRKVFTDSVRWSDEKFIRMLPDIVDYCNNSAKRKMQENLTGLQFLETIENGLKNNSKLRMVGEFPTDNKPKLTMTLLAPDTRITDLEARIVRLEEEVKQLRTQHIEWTKANLETVPNVEGGHE